MPDKKNNTNYLIIVLFYHYSLAQNYITVWHGFGVIIIYTVVKVDLLFGDKNKDMWEYRNNVLRRII
jgi:hypothetical protein